MPEPPKKPDRSFDEQARAMERANNSMLNMLDSASWKQLTQGFWEESTRWQNQLQKQVAHKAFNVPLMEGLNATTTTNNVRSGLGSKELLVLAAIAGGAAWYAADPQPPHATTPPPPPAAAIDPVPLQDREYQILHRDEQGNVIDVKPWPGSLQLNSLQQNHAQ